MARKPRTRRFIYADGRTAQLTPEQYDRAVRSQAASAARWGKAVWSPARGQPRVVTPQRAQTLQAISDRARIRRAQELQRPLPAARLYAPERLPSPPWEDGVWYPTRAEVERAELLHQLDELRDERDALAEQLDELEDEIEEGWNWPEPEPAPPEPPAPPLPLWLAETGEWDVSTPTELSVAFADAYDVGRSVIGSPGFEIGLRVDGDPDPVMWIPFDPHYLGGDDGWMRRFAWWLSGYAAAIWAGAGRPAAYAAGAESDEQQRYTTAHVRTLDDSEWAWFDEEDMPAGELLGSSVAASITPGFHAVTVSFVFR